MSVASLPTTSRLVLGGVSWPKYLRFLNLFDDRHVRITYDQGAIEIMTLSSEHERYKHILRRFVDILAEELGLDMEAFGSMTFKHEKMQRGLEPDECFWIQNESEVRLRKKIELDRQPPPDLVLEIDITHSALDRLSIYAKMKVPEIWQFDGTHLTISTLHAGRSYRRSKSSHAFQMVSVSELQGFLDLSVKTKPSDLFRQFRRWVRSKVSKGGNSN